MKKIGLIIFQLVLLLVSLPCLGVVITDEINEMFGQYAVSFQAKNISQVVSFFTDPCDIGGTVLQLPDLQAQINGYFTAQEVTTFEINNIQIAAIDDHHATVTCLEHTVDTLSGETFVTCRYTLVKLNNQWKITQKEFL